MTLNEIGLSEKALIKKVNLSLKSKKRLADMGVIKGCVITMIRRAPFGSPLEIKARDFYLAIRLEDAKKITVERI